jgi:hypothetical protein
MMKKTSLLMVMMSFLAMLVVPHAATGLSIYPSFRMTAPGEAISTKLMVRDFDLGTFYDPLIESILESDLRTGTFNSMDGSDAFFSTGTHFSWMDGGGSRLFFGYGDLFERFGFHSSYGGTTNRDIDPVPEPASMLLLGTALMGIAILVRKKALRVYGPPQK